MKQVVYTFPFSENKTKSCLNPYVHAHACCMFTKGVKMNTPITPELEVDEGADGLTEVGQKIVISYNSA